MDTKLATAISKYLSYILRHHAEEAEITLDANGWTYVDILIESVRYCFSELNKEMLEYIVATNSKQRFGFNEDKTMIRANQGHCVNVDTIILDRSQHFRCL